MDGPRPHVLVTRPLPGDALDRLAAAADVDLWPDAEQAMPRGELLARIGPADGLICLPTDRVDAELLAAAPRLRVISNVAVGYDNIDVEAATRRGILVTNTPGVLDEATADLTWALLLAVARRVVEGDRFVRAGRWRSWSPTLLLGTDLYGKTLGIVGMGRIGRAVARRAAGFGMRVLYHNRRPVPPQVEAELGAAYAPLDRLLAESHFITLHVPLTPETRHLIGRRELGMMRPDAILVNVARGPVVDEEALLEALRAGRIAGAGLDVFEREPQVTPGLLELPNVVLLPHLGSATRETRARMAALAVEGMLAGLRGELPANAVNAAALRGQ